jgi:hypothetical protein
MKKPFEETQRFTHWWIWMILISSCLVVTGLMINGIYTQIILGQPWGDTALPDGGLVAIAVFAITVWLAVLGLHLVTRLDVRVDEHTLAYRIPPIIRGWRVLDKDRIDSYRVVEPGVMGYGLHYRFTRRMLTANLAGDALLEITLSNKSKVRLGTRFPNELMAAINRIKSTGIAY